MDIPILGSLLRWFQSIFFAKHLQIAILGLQSAGKTSLVNVLCNGQFAEEMVPTIGFNMKKMTKGNVQIKMWDIGGQPRFRSMWERYARGVSAIVFVVDSAIPRPTVTPATANEVKGDGASDRSSSVKESSSTDTQSDSQHQQQDRKSVV